MWLLLHDLTRGDKFCRLPVSHLVPVKPGRQLHLNPLVTSLQSPFLLQVLLLAHQDVAVKKVKQSKYKINLYKNSC